MNPFVNLQKRSIQLPKGCKDLMDVLRPVEGPLPGNWRPVPKPDRVETRGLAHIEWYLSRLLESAAERRFLGISSLDGQIGLIVFCQHGVLTVTGCLSGPHSTRNEAVHALFAEAGLGPISDFAWNNVGTPMRSFAYPLPNTASVAAQLTAGLMRRAYGVTDEAGLDFLYDENL